MKMQMQVALLILFVSTLTLSTIGLGNLLLAMPLLTAEGGQPQALASLTRERLTTLPLDSFIF